MALLAAALPYLSTLLSVGGSLAAAGSARAQGKAAKRLKELEARELERQANEARAISQRQAVDEREKADMLISRAQALAAFSGGGATDQSVIDIIADIDGEGAYRAAVALYQGEREGQTLESEAAFSRMGGSIAKKEADAKATGYMFDAGASLAKGGTTLYDKYGSRPKPSSGTRID